MKYVKPKSHVWFDDFLTVEQRGNYIITVDKDQFVTNCTYRDPLIEKWYQAYCLQRGNLGVYLDEITTQINNSENICLTPYGVDKKLKEAMKEFPIIVSGKFAMSKNPHATAEEDCCAMITWYTKHFGKQAIQQ